MDFVQYTNICPKPEDFFSVPEETYLNLLSEHDPERQNSVWKNENIPGILRQRLNYKELVRYFMGEKDVFRYRALWRHLLALRYPRQ